MKRGKPLRRKKSLRQAYADKLRGNFSEAARRDVKEDFKRKPALKKVAASRRKQLAQYYADKAVFLALPENQHCEICRARKAAGENVRIAPASEIHHKRGRRGRLLCWQPGWIASCFGCREFPHAHPARARELGLLSSPAEWDYFPR